MKKNTVVMFILVAMLSVFLFGLTPLEQPLFANPQADTLVTSSTIAGYRDPHKVSFISDDLIIKEVVLEDGTAFGDSLPTPEEKDGYTCYGWLMPDGSYLTENVPVKETMKVIADYEKFNAFTVTETANGITVTVDAPDNALSSRNEFSVTAADANAYRARIQDLFENKIGAIKAVDISFVDRDGNKVQPALPVNVTMEIEGLSSSVNLGLVHIKDDGTAEKLDEKSEPSFTFAASGFSIYAIVEVEKPEIDFTAEDYMAGQSGVLVVYSSEANAEVAMLSTTGISPKDRKTHVVMSSKLSAAKNPPIWSFISTGKCEQVDYGVDCYYYIRSNNGKYLSVGEGSIDLTDTPTEVFVALVSHNVNGSTENKFALMPKKGSSYKVNLKNNPTGNGGFQTYTSNNFSTVHELFYLTSEAYEGVEVDVYFDVNGGDYPTPDMITDYTESSIKLPGYAGHKNGHAFLGWSLDPEADEADYFANTMYEIPETVTGNKLTFYAVYDKVIRVEFNANGGETPSLEFYDESMGEKHYPETEREGYRLLGWSENQKAKEAEFTTDDIITVPAENKTFYAVWKSIATVTFSVADGSVEPPSITDDSGTAIDLSTLKVTLNSGYDFDEWKYYEYNGQAIKVDRNGLFFIPDNDTTLYAVSPAKVHFDANGGDYQPAPFEGEIGDEINLAASNRDGYEFKGWKDSSGKIWNDKFKLYKYDETLTAVWGYTVTFDVKSGDKPAPAAITAILGVDEGKTFPEYAGNNSEKRTLYGWAASSTVEKGDTVYKPGDPIPAENLPSNTFYAVYYVTVDFDKNGGSSVSPSTRAENLVPGSVLDLSAYVASGKTGKTFIGWSNKNSNKELISNEYVVPNAYSKVYAVWGVTVTFDANGHEDEITSLPQSVKGLPGETFTAPRLNDISGHTFLGWTSTATSTNWNAGDRKDIYYANTAVRFPNSNTTLYAAYDGFVKVSFNANGGTGDFSLPESKVYNIGEQVLLPTGAGIVADKAFGGWSFASNLTQKTAYSVYPGGSTYVIPSNSPSEIVFYAVWNKTTGMPPAKFGIRLEKGSIAQEPSLPSDTLYTTNAGLNLRDENGKVYTDWGRGNVLIPNAVLQQQWVIDTEKQLNPPSYYVVNDVTRAVSAVPDDAEISRIMEANGLTFDKNTEYVLWYVFKYTGGPTIDGETYWHVDGTILERDKVNLVYDYGELLDEGDIYLNWYLPEGYQVVLGGEAEVGRSGSLDGTLTDPTLISNKPHYGWFFTGWNTARDGSGIEYKKGDKITLTAPTTTLYAQWRHETKTISVEKKWEGEYGDESYRPANGIVVNLLANEIPDSKYGSGILLNEGNDWFYEITVDKYDDKNREINYTWEEQSVPNYEFVSANRVGEKTTITNKLVTSVKVTKVWDDDNNRDGKRPASVHVSLSNGHETIFETDLTESTNWTYTVTGLPVYEGSSNGEDAQGVLINYSWSEVLPTDYTNVGNELDDTDESFNGLAFTIRNKYDSQSKTLTVQKVWVDNNDLQFRPGSLAVNLKGSDGSTRPVTLTAEDGWQASLSVPVYMNQGAQEIAYTWEEVLNNSFYTQDEPVTNGNATTFTNRLPALTITANSDSKQYDGTPLTNSGFTSVGLRTGDTAFATITGSQTVVGTTVNVASAARIINSAGEDVTASYIINYEDGSLEVTQRPLMITAKSDTKPYDGTALTNEGYDISTVKPLAAGDSVASVLVEGSQTVVGSSNNVASNAIILNKKNEDVTNCYNIVFVQGTLEVTPKTVTITADSDTKVYDGTALTKDSYTNSALGTGDSIESVTVTGSQTVAGTSDNVPSAAKIVNGEGKDVTGSYVISYANGTLEVTKKALTITADSDTKVYDGTALTKDTYSNTSLAEGDSIDSVTVTGTQTKVGTSSNVSSAAKIINAAGTDVTASYEITYANGTLEVTKKSVTVTADSDTKVYDGSALTKDSYTNTDLAEGDSFDSVTVTGSQTVVGTSANVPSAAKIVNGAGEDVTASYDLHYANGTLEVTKKTVTITADSDTKTYDGTALTKNSYTNTALAAGDSIDAVTVTGSQTVAGTSANVPSEAKIVNAAGEDVTSSYDIHYTDGTLEVTKKKLTITADSDTKVYDGTALTKNSYTNTALASGDSIDAVTVTGSRTVVGTSDNVPSAAKIVNTAGEDVTASYEITYANGTLEVTKKAVTITADSDTKVYDGTPLTKDSYTNTALASGDSIESVTVTGSQTVVGTSDNVPSEAKIVNAEGEDVTGSYEITYANGTLEVTHNQALIITADSDTKVYDGTALEKNSYQSAGLAAGDQIESVTVTGSQTVVGTSDNVPSQAKIVNRSGADVTGSYKITYQNGTLEVTKKAVTITADGDTKVYDGAALTKNSYTNTALATGDSIDSVTVTGSQTVVGTSNNVPSAAKIVNGDGEDVTASYEITYANGTLEVTKKSLTITADSDTKVYDGTALTKDSYTNTALASGDSIDSVTVTGSQTIVGTSNNVPSAAKIVNGDGEDVTASYEITYNNGTLEVTKKSLTITADSDTKVYDGSALTKDSYTNTALATGDSIESVTVTGSQTVVGSSDNVPSAAKIVNGDGEDVTASYEITYANGTLEVTKKSLTITADSDTKVYDGTALTKDSYADTGLAEGDSYDSVTVTGSQTVVGTSNNVPSAAKIVNGDGEDVTASYEITYANGTLEVTKKSVTITADSDTKVYDGTALTKNSYTNTALASGDSISAVTVTGSQTVVGSSDNVPSAARIINANRQDVTASYEITYANGTLEVTKKTVTITADSDTKVYDGTALTKNGFTNTDLAPRDKIESVVITGSQTVAGTSDNVPSEAKIINSRNEDVTESYEITYANGSLEVTKKALTIKADGDTKVYDGTALTKDSYTNTALAAGDSIDAVTVTGSQTIVGTSGNVPSAAKIVNETGVDVTASYEISYSNGTLEVTKKAVTITADSDTKVYDGTALTKDSYTNTALAAGDSIDAVTVTGSQTIVGNSGNVPSAAKIVNGAGEDVTGSYEITYANGSLEVTKKAVTITADSDTKIYDGTALTKDSYINTALAEGDRIESVTVTGSQTVVGKSNNVPSAAKIVNGTGEDVTGSYAITYANGILEVTQNQALIITADSDTKVYDGTALTKDSYTYTSLAAGDSIESVTVTGSQTVVGKSNNVPSDAKIVNSAGEDVTGSYKITYANGTLEVTKKAVTITADSDTKVYDGIALTKDSYTNTALAAGDSISAVTVTGSQIPAGTSDNVPSKAKIVNAAGEDVTASYEITYANGSLEVTKKALTITADSDTKVYDGTALTKNSYTNTALAEGDRITAVTVSGSQIVVGKSDNIPSAARIVNARGQNVTESYEITYAIGSLEVTKKAVTITADNGTKVYDGTALTKNSFTSTDLAPRDKIEAVVITGSQIVAGTSDNVPSEARIVNSRNEDVTESYEITYANGALEVTKKALTITADSDTKFYDGTALTKDSYTNTALAEGDSIDAVTVTGSQIVVGSSDNVPSAAKIINAADEDVTASYEITYANGTLEVTKKTVTITADSDTKVYDGTALTRDSYTNTVLAEGDSIDAVTVTGSQTIVGKSDNVPSAAKIINAAREDVTASYEINYVNGTLEVTKKSLTITADSDTKVYDGTALTKDTYTNTALGAGDSIDAVIMTGSQTVVGKSDNVPSAARIINSRNEDVTESYEITYANGSLEVTKKALTITADDDTKVYDGTALTKDSYTSTALAAGDSIDAVTVTGSQTTAGTSDNVPSKAKIVNVDGEDVTASYEITYANGTLEVTKKAITVIADSDTKVYDGIALTKNSYTNTALAEGDSFRSVTVTGEQTRIGSADNVPAEAVIINAARQDVTDSYEVSYVNGLLEVTKMSLTITADSDTKVYDGTPLTKESYTSTALAAGDAITSVNVSGSQTIVGVSDNVPSEAVIANAAGEDVTDCYEITYANGLLEVTQNQALIITADSDTKIYDGTELTKDSYQAAGLAEGDRIVSITVTGSRTAAGVSDNVPSEAVVLNADGEDVTASYKITYKNGMLEVTPKALTITADSDTKVYDGTALTKESFVNSELAEGDQISEVIVTGSRIAAGISDNIASDAVIVNAEGTDVTSSYVVTYVKGTLEITPKALTITADSDTKVYDGTALTKDSSTNSELVVGDIIESVTVTGSQTVAGSSANVPSDAKIVNEAGEDVTASYAIKYVDGDLKVTPKAVTVKADSDTKVYDAVELVKDSYVSTALAEGDSFSSVVITGGQLNVGTSENTPSEAVIVNTAGEDVSASYQITYIHGSLRVTPKELVISADSDVKIYDSTPLTKDSYKSTDLAKGDSIDSVTVTGSQVDVGISKNDPSEAVILNTSGEDVTANYKISYVKGDLKVTPRPVTVKADSFTKEYGMVDMTFTAQVTGTLNGDTVEYELSREPGEEPGSYPITASGESVQGNYIVIYKPGTLTITYNPSVYIVEKVWDDDNNRDGIRPVSLMVTLTGSDGSVRSRRLSDSNNWKASIADLSLYKDGKEIVYTWTEEAVEGYTSETRVQGHVTSFINHHAISRTAVSVNKVWDDMDNAGGTRPRSLSVVLKSNGAVILSSALNEENDWSMTVNNLPLNENGRPIEYVWAEQALGDGYHPVSSVRSGSTTTFTNSNLYNLTIHYVYANGGEAAPDYNARQYVGQSYSVDSPVIKGYAADQLTVKGEQPASDIEFTVVYKSETNPDEDIPDVTPTPEPTPTPTPDPLPGQPVLPEIPPNEEPEPNKDIPEPRIIEPDEEHPVVVVEPNILVDIDDSETALGLGEVFTSGSGYAME